MSSPLGADDAGMRPRRPPWARLVAPVAVAGVLLVAGCGAEGPPQRRADRSTERSSPAGHDRRDPRPVDQARQAQAREHAGGGQRRRLDRARDRAEARRRHRRRVRRRAAAVRRGRELARQRSAVPRGVPAGAQPATVLEVLDGDTLEVRAERAGILPVGSRRTLRLLEVDTPETVHPSVGTECYGPQASAFAARRLPVGSRVWLVADDDRRDRYGRDLRYVWTEDGDFFNLQAVRLGFAEAVLYEPNDEYIRRMNTAEAAARAAGRGLWGACTGGTPNPPALAPPPRPSPGRGCDPDYRGACVPEHPPDLDCGQIPGTGFASVGGDPHGLDDDDDGVACEG